MQKIHQEHKLFNDLHRSVLNAFRKAHQHQPSLIFKHFLYDEYEIKVKYDSQVYFEITGFTIYNEEKLFLLLMNG